MARMIPANLSFKTESKAEERLFYALRDSLDNSHTVFHSFDLPVRNLQNKIIDAEIDFLIFQQKKGLLTLEVKGGSIGCDGDKWLQNGKPLKESPYQQAKRNKYAISNYLEQRLGRKLPMSPGHAVCFPDVFTEMTDLPAEADPSLTITGNEIPHLQKVIPDILGNFKKDTHNSLGIKESEFVRKALIPVFEYGTSLADMIGVAEQKIFTLTEEQCNYLDFIGDRKRVLVKECAGTGKTVLALKKTRELALDGKKVLLVCYNIPLGQQLKKSTKDIKGNITATNYHKFCFNKLNKSGIDLAFRPEDTQFWEEEVPECLDKLLDEHPLEYDAIIVDEGQDFKDFYWLTIDKMLAPEGYLYIFYDPDQNLYGSDLQFPIDDKPFSLTTNCRNTRQICNELTKHTYQEMKIKVDTPEGTPIVEITCPTDQAQRKELSKILHNLVNEEKILPNKIVILGGHSIQNTCLGDNNKVGNFTIEHEPEGSNTIRYETYMRFKGCEADAVILLDVNSNDPRWNKNALYTAISRAKFLLYILKRGNKVE